MSAIKTMASTTVNESTASPSRKHRFEPGHLLQFHAALGHGLISALPMQLNRVRVSDAALMYSIQFIHVSGGVSSVSGDTLERVHARAMVHAAYFARSCVIATLPFLCRRSGVGWDATLPAEVKQELGEVLMRLYAME